MHLALTLFATRMQDSTDYATAGMLAGLGSFLLIILVITVVSIAGLWKTFQKAGEPGWAAIVPIYNAIVLLKISGKPLWWVILYIIPPVGFIVFVIALAELAKRFGKGMGFTIGLALLTPIFICILGFGDATYSATPRTATA